MDQKISQGVIDRARSDVVAVIGAYVQLNKSGSEYEACCPFHQERTPSFKVNPNKNYYYCFGCGASGDAIDFVSSHLGVNFPEAVKIITGEVTTSHQPLAPSAPTKIVKQDEWQPIVPVPAHAPEPPGEFNKQVSGQWVKHPISMRWAYLNASGDLIGYTARIELAGGGKDVLPQSYCVNTTTGEERWRWLSFDKPRPMYGLEKLAAHPGAQVMIVEGEKAADAGQQLFLSHGIPMDAVITVAWPGGAKAIKYIDWSPLQGRKIGLWPDADLHDYGDSHRLAGQRMPFLLQPGTQAMLDIYDCIKDAAAAIKFILPPTGPEYKCGWDLADASQEWPLLPHLKASSIMASEVRERFAVEEPEPDPDPEPQPPQDDTPPWDTTPEDAQSGAEPSLPPSAADSEVMDEFDDDLMSNGYFSILGHDHNEYFFFHYEKGQVLSRTAGGFTDSGLIELAPLQWWEAVFPANNGGINKKMAVNWIFRTANARGIYDPTRVRGRGAWVDRSRYVYHHGNYLTVDGELAKVTEIESSYVYPMAHRLPDPAEPLTDEDGRKLTALAELVRFTVPASSALMAGWVMLAPICGALAWRPHIWITGAPGSGKSTVQSKFCAALVKDIGIYAQGDSTEPGIRQKLKSDALPVLIDEAESNNERDRQRLENVIGLIRKTSTESQAETLKGTAAGDSQHYQIRSMFCLASINTNLPTKADIDRLTRLVIKSPDKRDPVASAAHWAKLEAGLNAINEDVGIPARMLARALKLMPVILESIKVFRRVAAVKFGTQRDGDQFGTLMAGCWALSNSTVATEADAQAMLDRYDFEEHTEDHDLDDAGRALEALLGAKLRVGSSGEYSVYELIRETSVTHRLSVVDHAVADATLKRHGIRVEHGLAQVWFGTSVSNLTSLVKNLPFVTALGAQLMRIEGAEKITPKKYNGTTSRGVAIPLAPILKKDGDGYAVASGAAAAEEYPF